jgi:predicted nucleotidyltransferase
MDTILPSDFRDFLRLLNSNNVRYLLIGGYAVSYHGYSRATADMDVWIALDLENANRVVSALREFGFSSSELAVSLFLEKGRVVRMGVPPLRIEILTTISGVSFEDCYRQRITAQIDGVDVPVISLEDLKINKRASGRFKDLADLEQLQ